MLGLENVIFVDAIAKKYVQSMLHNFNICYLGWKNKPIYRFGVSPNKLPEYLFSGVPVLHSFSGYGDVVMEARAGITVPANDKNAVVRAILQFMNMTEGEINQLGENGRRYVLENYDYAKLAEKLGEIIIE
jgi:glycosyltransferase involved in cell wall biosynthesis